MVHQDNTLKVVMAVADTATNTSMARSTFRGSSAKSHQGIASCHINDIILKNNHY